MSSSTFLVPYIYECRCVHIGQVNDFANTDSINEKLRVLHLHPKSYQPRIMLMI